MEHPQFTPFWTDLITLKQDCGTTIKSAHTSAFIKDAVPLQPGGDIFDALRGNSLECRRIFGNSHPKILDVCDSAIRMWSTYGRRIVSARYLIRFHVNATANKSGDCPCAFANAKSGNDISRGVGKYVSETSCPILLDRRFLIRRLRNSCSTARFSG